MVGYSPVDRMIYAWDKGYQITYNLTFSLLQSDQNMMTPHLSGIPMN